MNEGIIVDFRSAVRLPYEHWSVADTTRTPRQTSSVVRVFSLWRLIRPSQDGERAEPLANMLFGAKHANIAQHMPEARLPRSRRDARTL